MQQVAVLESSDLVLSEKAGRVRTCRINPAALNQELCRKPLGWTAPTASNVPE